jgi:hypothetical protein
MIYAEVIPMNIGDTVIVPLLGGEIGSGQLIAIKGDIAIVSGSEEIKRASDAGRSPIGVGFKINVVKPKKVVKKT